MRIEQKLADLGLVLPPELPARPGVSTPPHWARVRKGIVYFSGQSARNADGTSAGPFGKVPSEVPIEAARAAAHEIGHHARVSPGMAALPGNAAVVIGATVETDGGA